MILAESEMKNQAEGKPDANVDDAWITYTAIAASIGAIFLFLAIFYAIYNGYHREKPKPPAITDGGPPATPTHKFNYIIGFRADKASSNFNMDIGVIRVELLDRLNRYVTSFALPCFMLKFKIEDDPQQERPQFERPLHPVYVKTMTVLREQWAHTNQGELVTFDFIRRKPLTDIVQARVTHDCYAKGAFVSLKYIAIYDCLAKINYVIRLKDQHIKSCHPCPLSSAQLYPVDKITETSEELKSFNRVTAATNRTWFANCFGKLLAY